jgi:hypothetical protein
MLMSSGTSEILLNGVPGKKFNCRRGVRQGDPLSPLLFVGVSELLQAMVNGLFQAGGLIAPLNIPNSDFPIVQYADDTLLILQACPFQLTALKEILEKFAKATGLRVNYSKSCLIPINVADDKLQSLANTFGCTVGQLPFTYLGLPLGVTKPTIQDLSPLVGLVERRLNASARFLGYGGRLEFVRSVLSTLPTFYMCSLKIQKAVINMCNRAQRHCLWAKEEDSTSMNALAAWSKVCRPKKQGGLGVKNLEIQNKALLMKQLHKFYSHADTPWVKLVWSLYGDHVPHTKMGKGSFWWRDIFSLVGDYRSITRSKIGNGTTVLFWKDFWQEGNLMCDRFPRLFSFALDEDISVAALLSAEDLTSKFYLPLSVEAFQELQVIQQITNDNPLIPDNHDQRIFVWGEKYTSARYYRFLFERVPKHDIMTVIWSSKTLPKIKVFLWLLMLDRLNTRDIMSRKNWIIDSGTDCSLCHTANLETRSHLFFECDFARSCWNEINIHWPNNRPMEQGFWEVKNNFLGPCFVEVFACATWNIWKARNDFIFQAIPFSLGRWKVGFQSDMWLHHFRVKHTVVQPLLDCILVSAS